MAMYFNNKREFDKYISANNVYATFDLECDYFVRYTCVTKYGDVFKAVVDFN